MSRIAIAEDFFSLQGEGKTMGVPSLFIRLGGCNLLCGGPGTDKSKKIEGEATWRCDTIEVWRKSHSLDIEAYCKRIVDLYKLTEKDPYQYHIVITGGEPLMQQKAVIELILELRKHTGKVFVEIETNGTIPPEPKLSVLVDQFNISPKLKNSGEPLENRWKYDVLTEFLNKTECIFKFVVTKEEDIYEIKKHFFFVPGKFIYLMPGGSTLSALLTNNKMVAEKCIENCWNYSSRLQLEIWDQATGV